MSVPEGKRTRNKMDMLAATQKLAEYTVGICSNEKKFWSRDIASDIAAMAWRAHSLLTRANAVNVRPGCDPANYVERRSLQDREISELHRQWRGTEDAEVLRITMEGREERW